VTPKRADATCLIAERRRSPFASGRGPFDVLAALARVGPAAEAVHGDGQGLVRLGGDRAVAHRTRHEAAHDLIGPLDLLERHRRFLRHEVEERAQGRASSGLAVDRVGEGLEARVGVVATARCRRVIVVGFQP
jgi:hypothetical protein